MSSSILGTGYFRDGERRTMEITIRRGVLVLALSIWGTLFAQSWNSSSKAASASAKAVFLTYSVAGFYPTAVTRQAGWFLIHIDSRDSKAAPVFVISDSKESPSIQARVEKGKPRSVQLIHLEAGEYRVTANGVAGPACTITVEK